MEMKAEQKTIIAITLSNSGLGSHMDVDFLTAADSVQLINFVGVLEMQKSVLLRMMDEKANKTQLPFDPLNLT